MLSSCVWSWFYFFRCCFTTTIFEERATVREHANVLFHVSRSFRSCFNCACGMKRTRDVLSITAECCKTEEKNKLIWRHKYSKSGIKTKNAKPAYEILLETTKHAHTTTHILISQHVLSIAHISFCSLLFAATNSSLVDIFVDA